MTWSDREIAKRVGCSHVTVGKVRNDLNLSGQIDQIESRTVSRNGTTYTQAPRQPDAYEEAFYAEQIPARHESVRIPNAPFLP